MSSHLNKLMQMVFFYYGHGDFALGQGQNLFLYAWKTLLAAIRTQNTFTEILMKMASRIVSQMETKKHLKE